jgi:HEAT repeat protein
VVRRRFASVTVASLVAAVVVAGAAPAAALPLHPPLAPFVWPNVPERIARGLASQDPAERRQAAQEIGKLPAELAKPLVRKAMADEDAEVRIMAASVAAKLKLEGAGDLVTAWLSEPDARVRLAACEVIRVAPTDRSITALGRVLSDPSKDVRLAAAQAMGRSSSPEATSLLLGHLDDSAPDVRGEVATALGRLGDARAVLPLVGRVQDTDQEVRRRVARALGDLTNAQAISALVIALNDSSLDVRVEAALALGRIGAAQTADPARTEEATVALAPFAQATSDGSRPATEATHAMRQASLRALGRIGSPRAIDLLVAALEGDRPDAMRTPAREALVVVGPRAVKPLVALLSGNPSTRAATGAAQALGAIRDPSAVAAIVRGMQRGTVPVTAGLSALASLGSDAALPAVLELLSDQGTNVRLEAIRAAGELLDPSRPDGRAVDPIILALGDAGLSVEERLGLVEILGKTGSPRAAPTLVGLASTKPASVRRAVLVALGNLSQGSKAVDEKLLEALDDDLGSVRTDAAIALSRVGTPALAGTLLDRLLRSAEQDRAALGLALAGVLGRSTDGAVAERVQRAIGSAPSSARDALIEGLGRMKGAEALAALRAHVGGPLDDRRKIAEALGGHGSSAGAELERLALDPDAAVRANAAWSLGFAGDQAAAKRIGAMLKDPDVTVAGNAAASLGRLAGRLARPEVARPLCASMKDARAYVRANALAGLDLAGTSCDEASVADLLVSDPSDIVRLAAATHLLRIVASTPAAPASAPPPTSPVASPAQKTDVAASPKPAAAPGALARRALQRCNSEEPVFRVSQRCERAAPPPPGAHSRAFPLTVFIVPDGGDSPQARAPFALVRPDGTLRLGLADRRGAVFEASVPEGDVELAVPAPLAIQRP